MSELKITGTVKFDTGANSHFFDYRIVDEEQCIAFTDEEFAPIICEAFNVSSETGKTPRQLLEQRDEASKKFNFLRSVTITKECPECSTDWSEDECHAMLRAGSGGCICGYQGKFEDDPEVAP